MRLDLDAEREALEPFEVTVNGRTYRAKPLSWPAYRRVTEAAAVMEASVTIENANRFESALREAFRAAFPVHWRYLFRPKEDPVYQILELPPALRQRILRDFFDWAGAKLESPPSPKDGTITRSLSLAGETP
jgi:hypothetical protein